MAWTTRSTTRCIAWAALATQLVTVAPAFAVAPQPAAAPAPAPGAAVRSAPATLLRRASTLYGQARYDEAVTALFGPVNDGTLKGTELRDARVLMARCYVKKGLTARAKDLFAAVLAAEPAFVLDSGHADAEELAVFAAVRGPVGPMRAVGPQPNPPAATEPTAPRKPNLGPTSDGRPGGGWLARHKVLAAALAVGSGTGVWLLASQGSSKSTPAAHSLPAFPPPPSN